MPISLVLDIIIAVLLVLTITYAVRLNQRLSQLRSDKNELQQLAKTFAEATQRAEAGIQTLKISSEALQDQMKKAEVLKDDLAYLVDRGARTADEMVETVRKPATTPSGASRKFDPGTARADHAAAPRGAGRGGAQARRTVSDDDDEARLIENAIRAATPDAKGAGAQSQGAQSQGGQSQGGQNHAGVTRRVAGRSTGGAKGPGSLASRGLAVDDDLAPGMADPAGLEDSASARELLKALSSVK